MPFHAAVKEDPEPEVLEVAESMCHPEHLLHHEIDRFSGAIGGAGRVVGEDLGAPAGDRLGQAVKLGDGRPSALGPEDVEETSGFAGVVRRVHLPQALFGQQGVEHLVSGVAGSEAGLEAGTAVLGMALDATEQQAADLVEGVTRAPSMLDMRVI